MTDLVDAVVGAARAAGAVQIEETPVGYVFRTERRIFGSAKRGRGCVRGHLVLARVVEGDSRFTKAEPLTATLWFNGYRLDDAVQLDDAFRRLVEEAVAAAS